MRRWHEIVRLSGLFAFALVLPCLAAEADRGVVIESIAVVDGFGWEDGGLDDPVHPGDELSLVGTVTGLETIWGIPWQPETYSYTFHAHSIVASHETVVFGRRVIIYEGGEFRIDRDLLPSNHDYGVLPPNAVSPATFTDGESFLEGPVVRTELHFASDGSLNHLFAGLGAYTGGLINDPSGCGECVGLWSFQLSAPGGAVGPEIPEGYDFAFQGEFENYLAIAVQPATWGRIKALYR